MKFGILSLAICTATVAVFFAVRESSANAALFIATTFASVSFACKSSFQEDTSPHRIIAAGSMAALSAMLILGLPLWVTSILTELEWQITWTAEHAFTRVFVFRTLVLGTALVVVSLIYGGGAAFCGAMIGIAATHVIYAWGRGKKISDE